MPDVIVIATGDELLFGTTVNTNSAFISATFFGTNFHVKRHIITSDMISDIEASIEEALQFADVVITTGGLGPTDDDNTVEAVSNIFSTRIVIDNWHKVKMEDFFSSMEMEIHESDYKMVSYPEYAKPLKNSKGLAPGFMIEKNGKILISLPGVPPEMEEMFKSEVIPALSEKFGLSDRLKLAFKISGIRESEINSTLRKVITGFDIRFNITPKSGICDLVIVPDGNDFSFAEDLSVRLKNIFGVYILEEGMNSPEEELVSLLRKKRLTIATAESCTGGLLAKRITDIPGSSEVFTGAVVSYSNETKVNLLGVDNDTIMKYGAVSEETALSMVHGVKKLLHADISVSVTGIAGPGGGSENKPVGTVCFGFAFQNNRIVTLTKYFKGSRERIRTFSCLYAFNLLRKELKA